MLPEKLLAVLREAQHVCVLTGAGISAESGVPTFREAQTGLWEQYDPLELATPEAFRKDPSLVWRWYRWRRNMVAAAKPNSGHLALARLAQLVPQLTLITQNVDGLHQKAGSREVIEFHGNIFENRCFTEDRAVECDSESDIPACPHCGGPVRPGVVWFGEPIPETRLEKSFSAATDCSVFLSVGTSSLVYPAAGLAECARAGGAITVEINPNPTEMSSQFDVSLADKAGSVLPQLVDSLDDPGLTP